MHRARRAHALGALAVTTMALATGCSATNAATTQLQYDPADGQDVDLGAVEVDGLMVISASNSDGPGALVARLSNTSTEAQTVTMSGSGDADLEETTFDVPANGAMKIGPDDDDSATLETVGAKPGGLIHLMISGEDGTSRRVQVPVLSGAQPEFASLVPTPTPTFTPTPTLTPTTAPPTSSSRPSTSRSTVTPVRAPSPTPSTRVTEAEATPPPTSSPTPTSTLTLASDPSPSTSGSN